MVALEEAPIGVPYLTIFPSGALSIAVCSLSDNSRAKSVTPDGCSCSGHPMLKPNDATTTTPSNGQSNRGMAGWTFDGSSILGSVSRIRTA